MTDGIEGARPHRPVPYADLAKLVDAEGGSDAFSRAEVAAATAAVVLAAGRSSELVSLADTVGIDTLAELWRDSDPVSLPGVLFVMYLLRQWCQTQPDDVARLWRSGAPWAPVDAVVAGVADGGDESSIRTLADDVLGGAYRGDFGVALERAAAFFRVIAVGRRELSASGDAHSTQLVLAERNERTATDLATAAAFWRADQLH